MLQMEGKGQVAKSRSNEWSPNKKEAGQVKDALDQALKSLGSRSKISVKEDDEASDSSEEDDVEDYIDENEDDFADETTEGR